MKQALWGTTVLCILIFFSAAVAFADSSLPPPPNVRLTMYPQLNNEEQVFLCPTDSNIVIANWRDFRLNYRQVGIGRSTDGGQTWTDSLIKKSMQVFTTDSKQSDPTMTVDRLGNFYMSVLDWDAFGLTGLSTIAFYKSTDKGVSWTGPVAGVWSGDPEIFEDKQFITADRTGGIYDGNVYCSWTRFPNPDRIVFIRSIDGGATFQDTVVVGPQQTSTGCGSNVIDAGQFSIPVVGANGYVYVFWQGYSLDSTGTCTGVQAIKQVVSVDGGQSFTGETIVIKPIAGYMTANGGINTYSQPVVDVDISGGPFHGNMYMAFTNIGVEDVNNHSDVDFLRSTNNGATWSSRYQINDDVGSENIDNFHPWLVVNQEGVIVVVFYDQRYDAPNYYLFDLNAAYSFDGGLTFTTNHRISDVSSSPSNLKNNNLENPWTLDDNGFMAPVAMVPRGGLIGEYIGVTAYYDKVNAVWTDSRDGNSEVYSASWYIPLLEPRLIAPAEDSIAQGFDEFHWATAWKHNLDRYRLEIAEDSNFTTGLITRVVDTPFVVLDTNLDEKVYYWRVKSFTTDGLDSSAYSVVRTFTIDMTPPVTPVLVSPSDDTTTTNATPTFVFTASTIEIDAVYVLKISTDSLFPAGPETKEYIMPDTEMTVPDPLPADTVTYWTVTATDKAGNSSQPSAFHLRYVDIACGNIDGIVGPSGEIDVADLTYLVAYLFQGGPPPAVMEAANVDGIVGPSGPVDIADLTYLVAYLFSGGPPPVC